MKLYLEKETRKYSSLSFNHSSRTSFVSLEINATLGLPVFVVSPRILIFTGLLQASLTNAISIVSPIAFTILAVISILLIVNVDIGKVFPKIHAPVTKNPLVSSFIFGFFFVGGQVYVDKKAPKEIRAQAQGLIVLICYGIGMLVGNFFNGKLISYYMTETIVDGVAQKDYNWNAIWAITTVISIVLLAALCLVFRDDVTKAGESMTVEGRSDEGS